MTMEWAWAFKSRPLLMEVLDSQLTFYWLSEPIKARDGREHKQIGIVEKPGFPLYIAPVVNSELSVQLMEIHPDTTPDQFFAERGYRVVSSPQLISPGNSPFPTDHRADAHLISVLTDKVLLKESAYLWDGLFRIDPASLFAFVRVRAAWRSALGWNTTAHFSDLQQLGPEYVGQFAPADALSPFGISLDRESRERVPTADAFRLALAKHGPIATSEN